MEIEGTVTEEITNESNLEVAESVRCSACGRACDLFARDD
jgi:hypothetical protein